MYPVLLNIGSFPVSSFGFLLAIGIFLGGFTVWRIARGYEFDPEKILDLLFLTVGFGFLFSRLVFVLTNLDHFKSIPEIFFLNRYPGLSFWGGVAGGLGAFYFFSKRIKFNFFELGDFAIVGLFIAAFFAEIGCLLGGCGVGVESSFLGVEQVGIIGRRFPIQLFEALAFLLIFWVFWRRIMRFHVEGSILAKGLILIGVVKFISEFFKSVHSDIRILNFNINLSSLFSLLVIFVGFRLYYKVNKKTFGRDLSGFGRFFISRKTQTQTVVNLQKWCYNHWVNLWIGVGKGKKRLFKMLNIRPNPEKF